MLRHILLTNLKPSRPIGFTNILLSHSNAFSSQANQEGRPVRVRYAPSPTGSLHLGGLRTALYNYIFSRKFEDGKCLLRVEDTDRTRLVHGAVEQLLQDLKWSGLHFDEGPHPLGGDCGPYTQSERLDIYSKYSEKLLDDGHAYRCFCTAERLDELRQNQSARGHPTVYDKLCSHLSKEEVDSRMEAGLPHVVRMKIPDSGNTVVSDAIRGDVVFQNRVIDDQVLMKSDGFPTYHLANIVDDHLMGITHVIRGEEWLPSAGKHVLLYKMFGWTAPVFAHLPLLLREDGSKLSKRFKDSSLDYYITKGYLPEAIINFVALLGWHPPSSHTSSAPNVESNSTNTVDSLRAALDADLPQKKSKARKQTQIDPSSTVSNVGAVNDSELLSIDDMVKLFSLEKVQKGGAAVEMHKLNFFHNQYYMRLLHQDIDRLAEFVRPHIETAIEAFKKGEFCQELSNDESVINDNDISRFVPLLNGVQYNDLIVDPSSLSQDDFNATIRKALLMTHDHPCLLPEFPFRVFSIFARPNLLSSDSALLRADCWVDTLTSIPDKSGKKAAQVKLPTHEVLLGVCDVLQNDPVIQAGGMEGVNANHVVSLLKSYVKENNIGLRDVYLPMRYVLSGTSSGPGVAEQIIALGIDEVITRVNIAINLLQSSTSAQ